MYQLPVGVSSMTLPEVELMYASGSELFTVLSRNSPLVAKQSKARVPILCISPSQAKWISSCAPLCLRDHLSSYVTLNGGASQREMAIVDSARQCMVRDHTFADLILAMQRRWRDRTYHLSSVRPSDIQRCASVQFGGALLASPR